LLKVMTINDVVDDVVAACWVRSFGAPIPIRLLLPRRGGLMLMCSSIVVAVVVDAGEPHVMVVSGSWKYASCSLCLESCLVTCGLLYASQVFQLLASLLNLFNLNFN